jgi:hypothetical protein
LRVFPINLSFLFKQTASGRSSYLETRAETAEQFMVLPEHLITEVAKAIVQYIIAPLILARLMSGTTKSKRARRNRRF